MNIILSTIGQLGPIRKKQNDTNENCCVMFVGRVVEHRNQGNYKIYDQPVSFMTFSSSVRNDNGTPRSVICEPLL